MGLMNEFDHARLRQERRRLGLTQVELAGRAGVSRKTLRRAEQGDHAPRPDIAKAIADALGIDVLALWCDEVAA
jgi:transcriptional regulator with XRE-family HTH domain